jgi:polyketide biosynthesis enoyl-CoA hydratase PksH
MNNSFHTLEVTRREHMLEIVLNRPERQNALTAAMLEELHTAIDMAEADPDLRLAVLSAKGETFCAGMDFAEAASDKADPASLQPTVDRFYRLMERFAQGPTIIATMVEGRVTAGGVGLVAASDYAIAGPRASFQLSEVIFGLLPATIAPFIVRRCGLHPAYRLSLTARRIGAVQAAAINLVDEVSDDPAQSVRHFLLRAARVQPDCAAALKALFRDIWISNEATRQAATAAITERIARPEVMEGIRRFVQDETPPWRP